MGTEKVKASGMDDIFQGSECMERLEQKPRRKFGGSCIGGQDKVREPGVEVEQSELEGHDHRLLKGKSSKTHGVVSSQIQKS